MDYSKHLKATPQTLPILGKNMVMNNAGGYTFQITKWAKLDRFLFLGTEGGSYYVSEQKLTIENSQSVIDCIKEDGPRVIQRIVEVSTSGRAFKNDPAIFALVLALTYGNEQTKKLGYDNLWRVCRIGTHLFTFCTMVQSLRKWSGGLRRAVSEYYTRKKSPDDLVYDLLKYQSRNGFSHRDVLRLAHVKPETNQQAGIFGYATGKEEPAQLTSHKMIEAVHGLKKETNVKKVVKAIVDHKLPREVIPTQFLNDVSVWEALLPTMPITALVRNLGKMSSIGLFDDLFSENTKIVLSKLDSQESIIRSKIHPISVLLALKVYEQGQGVKGSLTWKTNKKILNGLNEAFYHSFKTIEPTNKNILLSLDVSGSMTTNIANTFLNSMEVCAAFAMATARTEPNYEIMGFSSKYIKLNITASDDLQTVLKTISRLPFSATDCSLPFMFALQSRLPVDVFGVYTDNETYVGKIHPKQALDKFRKEINPKAKSYIVATEATSFSIADPNDAGMLDIAGFDSNLPSIIDCFIRD